MCERYVMATQAEVEAEFAVARPWWKFVPSFNVGYGRRVPAIRLHEGETEGVMLRWGLIPEWAEGKPTPRRATTAASESLLGSDHFRGPWLEGRRCIVPMAGFYLWQLTPQRYRQPYYVQVVGRDAFGVAALWERSVTDDDEDDVIESCALLTVPANALLAELDPVHARMPAILQRRDYRAWLEARPGQAQQFLRPYPADQMLVYAVSPRVNALENDDAALLQPVQWAG